MSSLLPRHTLSLKRWPLYAAAALLLLILAAPAAIAPSGALPGETLPPRPAIPAPAGEVDRTGYVKGFYVSYAAMGNAGFMQRTHELLEQTELNAVVFDFKGDRGFLAFPTEVAVAAEVKANAQPMVDDPAEFMRWFEERGVYTIARIVTFKDNQLAKYYPEWAILDTATGAAWRDQEGMAWIDPNRTGAWDYNVALAREAAAYGFDEVQFDYVRFPTDGNVGGAVYSMPNTYEVRTAAIGGFLGSASAVLRPLGVKTCADVFGYTAWVDDDLGIGQHLEALAPLIDVLAPMVYPSTYNAGMPGEDPKYRNAVAYPYEIVNKSTERALRRMQPINPAIEIRPWLQDFGDYAFDYRTYTAAEIRRQMDGARDAGARGWLLWDPAVRYTSAALASAQPAFLPNIQGKIPVLAYGEVSSSVLRSDLAWLLEQGFYPTTLSDLATGGIHGVPAGKKAVVLTFDGSPASHFRLLEGGRVDPESAVGALLAFGDEHPADFPPRGTFFVKQSGGGGEGAAGNGIFGTADLASFKLSTLLSWGFEIGVMPLADEALQAPIGEERRQSFALAQGQLEPLMPGYLPAAIALPAGLPQETLDLLASGTEAEPGPRFTAAVEPGGGVAPSPFLPGFAPYRIPRLPAGDAAGNSWREAIEQSEIFISAGE